MHVRRYSIYHSGARLGAYALIGLGLAVLVGWAGHVTVLMAVLPDRITMKPNTAVGFLAAGLALFFLGQAAPQHKSRKLAAVMSGLVTALGALTLVEYGAHRDLGIDQLLFRDPWQFPFPGRMAHITAMNFCLAGGSLLLLSLSRKRAMWPQFLALLSGASALLAIIGYLYGVPLLYGSTQYTSMALHTGLGFLILSASILHSRPESGMMGVVTSPHVGGWIARRLMPIAVVTPVILGAIYLHSRFALTDARMALACLMVVQIGLFVSLIWGLAYQLNQAEAERKVANAARDTSEAEYQKMFEEAIIGIFESTPDGKLLKVNPAMARMYGYASGEEMKGDISDAGGQLYVDPDRRQEFRKLMDSEGSVRHFECQMRRRDGSSMWVSVNARAVTQNGEVVRYGGSFEEVTARKSLEDQLRQAQKMEAVGRLAGGVAHDFNNAIGVIVGYSALLQERLASDATAQRYANEIGNAGQRAAGLTRQLLAFSRKQVIQPVVLNLNTVVGETEKMLRRLIGEDIELVIIRSPNLGNVRADMGQVDQILMNLVINARDAMPRGGRLVIETSNAELDETNLSHHAFAKPGRYVLLSVSDNGCGMNKEILSHIFEPFFTTKGAGKGTGLGLSTVYGIVKQNEGYIWVYSEVGQGARFKIYLPRVDAAAAAPSDNDDSTADGGAETILLVEDDDAMRSLTRSCLESSGYRVLDASDGEAAIRTVTQQEGPIHLLLTDVIMPGASGRQVAESLRVARPEMKVLYMSGYTADIVAERGVLDADVSLLEKPFTKEALLKKVRRVLDGEAAAEAAAGAS
ncbi:MAG TPA: ATP-binding protein [Terriglobales bacterium]|nr:ATP-binding protein [Terriglobales bacterium]